MPSFAQHRTVKRALMSLVGLTVAFTGVMGFAHTKPGRPLLALMGMKGKAAGCPFGYDVAQTAEQKEASRRRFASTHAGETRAATRPALGFKLDETTRADVTTWATAHGVACKTPRSGADLDCSDVPSAALPEAFQGTAIKSLWLTFGAGDRLISVVTVRRDPSAEAISSTFGAVTSEVTREAGPARMTDGDPSAPRLRSALLRQASAEYRFRDYYALARATNLGDGFALTEEYRSLPD